MPTSSMWPASITDGPFFAPLPLPRRSAWTEPMTLVVTSSACFDTNSRNTLAAGCSKPDGEGASVRSLRNFRSAGRIGKPPRWMKGCLSSLSPVGPACHRQRADVAGASRPFHLDPPVGDDDVGDADLDLLAQLSLIHISEPTRLGM